MTPDPPEAPDQACAAGLQVRGGADAVEMAALLASLAQLQRRSPPTARRRRPPTGWRATRLAALGLTGRSG